MARFSPANKRDASLPFLAWPGKRNFNGWYWSRTTIGHIPFESLFEQEAMTMFDFDHSVINIVAQPFALLWPRSASHHYPDVLLLHRDRTAELVDVRPRQRIDRELRPS